VGRTGCKKNARKESFINPQDLVNQTTGRLIKLVMTLGMPSLIANFFKNYKMKRIVFFLKGTASRDISAYLKA
jgi:hypothetical protein